MEKLKIELFKQDILDKNEILNLKDLMLLFGIKRTTMFKLLKADVLPVVKIGKQYLTTRALIYSWFEKMQGKEINFF